MERKKHVPECVALGPCSVEQLSRGRWEHCACLQGREGVNLGRTVPAATLSALNVYCMCTVPGTDSNIQSLPLHVWGPRGETDHRNKQTSQGSWLQVTVSVLNKKARSGARL